MKNFISNLNNVNIKIIFNTDIIVDGQNRQKGEEFNIPSSVAIYKTDKGYEYEVSTQYSVINTILKEQDNNEFIKYEFEDKDFIKNEIAKLEKKELQTKTATQKEIKNDN